MNLRDLYSGLALAPALPYAVQTATAYGTTVDCKEAGGVFFALITAAIAGAGVFGAGLQESVDGVTWVDVNSKWVQSNAPTILAAQSVYRLGYTGKLRYARLALTYVSGTSIGASAVAVVRPLKTPVA